MTNLFHSKQIYVLEFRENLEDRFIFILNSNFCFNVYPVAMLCNVVTSVTQFMYINAFMYNIGTDRGSFLERVLLLEIFST